MSDKLCIVTGGNSGVGFEAALRLARTAARVVLICRRRARGEVARERISSEVPGARISLEVADLSSLRQVRELGRRLAEDFPRIDLLVNNAGVYRSRLELTEEGFERTLAVNHLSHFLLTHLLLESLRRASGKVVNVSSEAHRGAKLDRASLEDIIRGREKYNGWLAYSDSKLANILFTMEFTRRQGSAEPTMVALHPGVLATQIWNQNSNFLSLALRLFKPFMGRPGVGGEAICLLAEKSHAEINGKYYDRKSEAVPAPPARDPDLADRLWALSARLTGESP